MKLLYTDIRTSLTKILTREAEELVAAGKRVFYIAPNSLSFEKERAVLKCLSQQVSFAITVTRFAQMARYLILNDLPAKTSLDDIGLGMAFYKCLAELDPKDLRVYGAIKQDPQFIQQLIDLYHEMTTAQMSFLDLESLTDEDKRADLLLIFEKVTAYLNQGQLAQGSQLSHLIEAIENDKVSSDFTQIALVIDGFTRFSAEELIYRGVLMTTFFKNSPWYGDVLLSAIIFGYIHVNFALTPLAFFIYASGGLILALLYRITKNVYYPILVHIFINITAFWNVWLLLFSGS